MIPAPFTYHRASSLADAVALLDTHEGEAHLLAGGHSLLPLMRLRLAVPAALVDIGRVPELRGVFDDGSHLRIGATTSHHEVVHDPLVRRHCALLAAAAATVGDPQVRHRGTIGGALAHADPAGDLPAVVCALDAELVAQGPQGRRTIPAAAFFAGYLETALAPDEVLAEVRVPKTDGWGFHYEKFSRVMQDWAIVGACALVRVEDGGVREARVGLTNMGAVPLRALAVERALQNAPATPAALATAAEGADDGTDPPADLGAQPDYRRHLARVLTRRALERAVAATGARPHGGAPA